MRSGAMILLAVSVATTGASASARPRDRLGAAEVAVLVARHRTLDRDGSAGCLNPASDGTDIDDSAGWTRATRCGKRASAIPPVAQSMG